MYSPYDIKILMEKILVQRSKMERFSYKGGCGVGERMHIKSLKEELAWAIDKRLQVVSNKMLFKIVIPLRN